MDAGIECDINVPTAPSMSDTINLVTENSKTNLQASEDSSGGGRKSNSSEHCRGREEL